MELLHSAAAGGGFSSAWEENRAAQLLQIIHIEDKTPPQRQTAAVFAAAPAQGVAHCLVRRLAAEGASAVVLSTPGELRGRQGAFSAVVLLSPLAHEALAPCMAEGGLVVDATTAKGSEWAVHDPGLHFRRVRVASFCDCP